MNIIELIINALKNITVHRYYKTERGFVAEFYRTLSKELEVHHIFPEHTILETEVQKRASDHYGITQRPDLLIHIPIETGLINNANENNFVNFAFKLNGKLRKIRKDFEKLEQMFQNLNYEMGVFININAFPNTYLEKYEGNFKSRIHEFSIRLNEDNSVEIVYAFYKGNKIYTENY